MKKRETWRSKYNHPDPSTRSGQALLTPRGRALIHRRPEAVDMPPPLKLRGGWEGLCFAVAVTAMALVLCSTMALAATVNLPKTGQTTKYATGDDGDLQEGVAWPTSRFTVGTGATAACVTDNLTGLIWVKTPDSALRTWQAAIDYAKGLTLCGYTDWRLPSIVELESLVNAEAANPAAWLNTQGFSNVQPDYYWSGTTYAVDASVAWIVTMGYGNVSRNDKGYSYYVWPVRGGQ